jgi:hypothetical protein
MAVSGNTVEAIEIGGFAEIEPITLGGNADLSLFEETAAAVSAVSEHFGQDAPLMVRSDDGKLLLEELDEPDGEPVTFSEASAYVIRTALESAAHDEHSIVQAPAKVILEHSGETGPHPLSRRDGVVRAHVQLGTFSHLTTAMHAVTEFASEQDGQRVVNQLAADLDRAELSSEQPTPFYYWGDGARLIYESLLRSAARDETLFDAAAAQMIIGDTVESLAHTLSIPAEFRDHLLA